MCHEPGIGCSSGTDQVQGFSKYVSMHLRQDNIVYPVMSVSIQSCLQQAPNKPKLSKYIVNMGFVLYLKMYCFIIHYYHN